jgi:hypothetical protein
MKRTASVVLVGVAVSLLVGCWKPAEPPRASEDQAKQRAAARLREEEFARKERCAIAAERLDKQFKAGVDNVFYSPTRNSCVCEIVGTPNSRGRMVYQLYDCLTRENLGIASIDMAAPDSTAKMDAWQAKRDALK